MADAATGAGKRTATRDVVEPDPLKPRLASNLWRISAAACLSVWLAGCRPPPLDNLPPPISDELPGPARRPAANPSQSSTGVVGFLPDARTTPGATLEVTAEDVCTAGYSKLVRSVPSRVKEEVYAEYGIASHEPGEYEVDHLISLELGGSNSVRNLWPQSYRTQPWNAHEKDKLENRLHRMVCDGTIDLKTAQRAIASDWIAAYRKYMSPNPPNYLAPTTKFREQF